MAKVFDFSITDNIKKRKRLEEITSHISRTSTSKKPLYEKLNSLGYPTVVLEYVPSSLYEPSATILGNYDTAGDYIIVSDEEKIELYPKNNTKYYIRERMTNLYKQKLI